MLKKLKAFVFNARYLYHRKMADYYFSKVDEYGPENNDYYMDKIKEHVHKEFEMAEKLLCRGDLA